MKLGTETNSLVNHIYSRGVIGQPEPVEGMGATILCWTDRHAATITKVWQLGKALCITVQDDTARVVSGSTHDGSAVFAYSPNPRGAERHYRRRPDGRWEGIVQRISTGRWIKTNGEGLRIGDRDEYCDPSF